MDIEEKLFINILVCKELLNDIEKEVEEIKMIYDTDLKDFEVIEVNE